MRRNKNGEVETPDEEDEIQNGDGDIQNELMKPKIPFSEIIGEATVKEHLPKPEISLMATSLFCFSIKSFLSKNFTDYVLYHFPLFNAIITDYFCVLRQKYF